MTNQECNQMYWTIPEHYRNALDALLALEMKDSAAHVLKDQCVLCRIRVPTLGEAKEWAKWRLTLRNVAGKEIVK
jgi:hypothetical protein